MNLPYLIYALTLLFLTGTMSAQSLSSLDQAVITSETSAEALKQLIEDLSAKSIELSIEREERDGEKLVALDGTIKIPNGSTGSFQATELESITIIWSKDGDGIPQRFEMNVRSAGTKNTDITR